MSDNGKSYRAALAKVDRSQRYALEDSLRLVKETARAKFDETVELAIRLGVDPRQADQNVRGTVSLPHGMGKTVRVLAFAKGEKEKEAQDAGADFVGSAAVILGEFSWAAGSIYSRHAPTPRSPFQSTAMQKLAASAALLLLRVLLGERWDFDANAECAP